MKNSPDSNRLRRSCCLTLILGCAAFFWRFGAQAAEPIVEVVTQNGVVSTDVDAPETADLALRPLPAPLLISFGAHLGYDDNFATAPAAEGSWFADEQVLLSYSHARGPTTLSLLVSGGVIERFGNKNDENALLDLTFSFRATNRLTLDAKIHAAYQAEPDFSSNLGPNRRAGNYFATTDEFDASYEWSRRISTVTSYLVTFLRYENDLTAAFTDRDEHTFGQEVRFNLLRGTTLVADYRFMAVDYVTAPQDSLTHFLLAGAEQQFNSRLQAQARVGVSFRSFEQAGSETDPTFEGSLNYLPGRHSSLTWTVRYGVEQATTIGSSGQTTLRTGLQFQYAFTTRLSSSLGFYYQHNDQSGSLLPAGASSSSSDSYDLLLGLRYQISRHVDADVGFQHTETDAEMHSQSYSRNRYSIGMNITF